MLLLPFKLDCRCLAGTEKEFVMQRSRFLAGFASLVVLTAGAAASPVSSGASTAAGQSWTADNGNGTYSNPLFYEEFEDPDVTRVGEDYYPAGTTMHMNPALIVLHLKDLVNWELAGYGMERLDLGPAFRLEGGNIYGRGIWAPCIRYHGGMFYVFSNVNGVGRGSGGLDLALSCVTM
jgi:hypothetical protein